VNANFSSHALAQITLGFGCVLIVNAALSPLFRKIRQPQVIVEIAAGIMLGPSLLGLIPGNPSAWLFPHEVQSGLSSIAQVGVLLFIFLVGWETDFTRLLGRRAAALSVSLASVILPLVSGTAFALVLYHSHSVVAEHHVPRLAFLLFIGIAMAITALPVLARIVAEHGIQSTPAATLALASAAAGDALAWCLLAVVSIIAASSGYGQLWQLIGWATVYITVLIAIVRPLLHILVTRLSDRATLSPYLPGILAAGAFVSGYFAQRIGLDSIFGAFFFGLMMPRGSFTETLSAAQSQLSRVAEFLLPMFFVSTGLAVNVTQLGGGALLQLAGIIGLACLTKLTGAFGAARLSGMSTRDSTTVALLMNTRGLTELIILNVGMQMGILDRQIFTMMVLMALVTTGMTGPLLPARAYPARQEPDYAPTSNFSPPTPDSQLPSGRTRKPDR
jgi:Kef-type K+ transport system membrane component KefB